MEKDLGGHAALQVEIVTTTPSLYGRRLEAEEARRLAEVRAPCRAGPQSAGLDQSRCGRVQACRVGRPAQAVGFLDGPREKSSDPRVLI